MQFIKLSTLERKRFGTIILCFLIAIVAWFFMALNKRYTYNVETQIIYTDEPQSKALRALQADTVDLKVEGNGWQLIFDRFKINPSAIKVSLNKLNTRNYILLSEQLNAVNNQLESTQKIISIQPDTLFFDFSKRITKKVPIVLIAKIKYDSQYSKSAIETIFPNMVTISGTEDEISNIQQWRTDTLHLNHVFSSIDTLVHLKNSSTKNISLSPTKVNIKIPVEEFTEKKLDIPLKIINNPEFENVKLYPQRIEVILKVALSKYDDIKTDNIEAVVDFNQWKKNKQHQFLVQIKEVPPFTKVIFVKPQYIDFLIEKK